MPGGSPVASLPIEGSESESDEVFIVATAAPAGSALTPTPHVIAEIVAS